MKTDDDWFARIQSLVPEYTRAEFEKLQTLIAEGKRKEAKQELDRVLQPIKLKGDQLRHPEKYK